MANRIVVDPITRIEGHLRIEVEVKDGVITDAYSSSPMVRGLESIVQGRDPRDVWAFVQRACGVCTTVHALASVRSVEDALGINIPPNAEMVRNIMEGTLYMHDHVVHFYHLHALDWVDVVNALKADPAATSTWPRVFPAGLRVPRVISPTLKSGSPDLSKADNWGFLPTAIGGIPK